MTVDDIREAKRQLQAAPQRTLTEDDKAALDWAFAQIPAPQSLADYHKTYTLTISDSGVTLKEDESHN